MHVIDKVLSEEEFRAELINRFFHTKSYFFRCISRELENVLTTDQGENHDFTVLVGNLFDELVGSENKIEFLDTLSKIHGFDTFQTTLDQGIRNLWSSPSDAEKLKNEIENLTRSLFDALFKSLQQSKTKEALKRILDSSEEKDEISFQETAIIEHEDGPLIQEDGHLKENCDNIRIVEPFLEEFPEADTEKTPESHFDYPEKEEKDFLRTETGMDAKTYGGCDDDLSEENGSAYNSISAPTFDDETIDFKQVFKNKIHLLLRKLHVLTVALEDKPNTRKQWLSCARIFEEIVSQAMVYGFEEFEQISLKAGAFIHTILADPEKYSNYGVEILQKTHQLLQTRLEQDLDGSDDGSFSKLAKEMNNPVVHSQEKESKSEEAPEPRPDLKKEQSEFKLPGEDDEEILKLVNEISHHAPDNNVQPRVVETTESPPLDAEDVLKSDQFPGAGTEVSGSQPDDHLNLFKEKAEFYFKVVEDALERLKAKPNDKIALEDLELTSHSLDALSQKLGLEPLSRIPAAIESLVRKIISEEDLVSEEQHRVICDLYRSFREITQIEETESQQIKHLLASLQETERSNKIISSIG